MILWFVCQLLHELILTCLTMAQSAGMSTIAFPTLGCGNFGYRAKDVVSCFQRAASTVGGLQVTVVTYLTNVCDFMPLHNNKQWRHPAFGYSVKQLVRLLRPILRDTISL